MRYIAFFLIFVITFLGFMSLYGTTQADMQRTEWINSTYNISSDFYADGEIAPAPECDVGGGWTSFADVPKCVWNYMTYGIAASMVSSDVALITLFIFVPLSVVFMFMMVKAFVRG